MDKVAVGIIRFPTFISTGILIMDIRAFGIVLYLYNHDESPFCLSNLHYINIRRKYQTNKNFFDLFYRREFG
jgi:hypothetical protein